MNCDETLWQCHQFASSFPNYTIPMLLRCHGNSRFTYVKSYAVCTVTEWYVHTRICIRNLADTLIIFKLVEESSVQELRILHDRQDEKSNPRKIQFRCAWAQSCIALSVPFPSHLDFHCKSWAQRTILHSWRATTRQLSVSWSTVSTVAASERKIAKAGSGWTRWNYEAFNVRTSLKQYEIRRSTILLSLFRLFVSLTFE